MENWNRNLYKYNYGRNNALKLQVVGELVVAEGPLPFAFDLNSGSTNVSTAEAEKKTPDDEQKALKQAKFNIINLSCEV